MFLRSARNAGFNVPKQAIDDAVGFVRRAFQKNYGAFGYTVGTGRSPSRGTAGAGILALGHAGFHNSFEAQRTGQWLMQYSFEVYNDTLGLDRDRYHYSLFNCCQGMYQLGSPFWEQFFPRTVRVVLAHQQPDGSWDAESYDRDRPFGNSYTTALVLLSLGRRTSYCQCFSGDNGAIIDFARRALSDIGRGSCRRLRGTARSCTRRARNRLCWRLRRVCNRC